MNLITRFAKNVGRLTHAALSLTHVILITHRSLFALPRSTGARSKVCVIHDWFGDIPIEIHLQWTRHPV